MTLLVHQKKNKSWGPGSIIILSYLIFGIISFLLYQNPSARRAYGSLSFFPFLYLYVALLISSLPIIKFDTYHIEHILPPSKKLLNYFSIIFILISLTQIPSIVQNITSGMISILTDSDAGLELYKENSGQGVSDGSISNIFAIVYNVVSPVSILFLFFYLTLRNPNIIIIIGYGACVLIDLLSQLSRGLRTSTTLTAFTIIITYFAFKPFFTEKVKYYVKRILLISFILVAIPFLAITISRFGSSDKGASSSLLSYMGMSTLNFNNYGLDAGGIRYGDRTSTIFKQMLGMDTVTDFYEARFKYSHLKMDDSVFYTFIGDFTLDYGPVIAFVLFCVFSYIFCNSTKPIYRTKTIPFYKLILLYFAMSVCMQGSMYLFSFSYTRNLVIIAMLLIYLVFYLDYKFYIKR